MMLEKYTWREMATVCQVFLPTYQQKGVTLMLPYIVNSVSLHLFLFFD